MIVQKDTVWFSFCRKENPFLVLWHSTLIFEPGHPTYGCTIITQVRHPQTHRLYSIFWHYCKLGCCIDIFVSLSLGYFLEVGMLSQRANLWITVPNIVKFLSREVVSFCIPHRQHIRVLISLQLNQYENVMELLDFCQCDRRRIVSQCNFNMNFS